jgi:hypothetical protein
MTKESVSTDQNVLRMAHVTTGTDKKYSVRPQIRAVLNVKATVSPHRTPCRTPFCTSMPEGLSLSVFYTEDGSSGTVRTLLTT